MCCSICGNSQFNRISVNQTFGVDIVQCLECGFIQTEPVSVTSLSYYYSNYYRENWTEQTIISMREESQQQAAAQVTFLEEKLGSLTFDKILDYGAADGELLRALRPNCKSLFATELDPTFAKQLQDQIWIGFLYENELYDEGYQGKFDLIIISHVLEHLPDPGAILRLFATMLAPGGILLVDVPHEIEMLAFGGHGSGHLYFFTVDHLCALINRDNLFELIEVRRCNRSINDFIESGFTLPEDHSITNNKNGTTIRALFRNRDHGCKASPFLVVEQLHEQLFENYSLRILKLHHDRES